MSTKTWKFEELIRLAIYGTGKDKITLGGVTFWFEDEVLCYSNPVKTWDKDAIYDELYDSVILGFKRAQQVLTIKKD